MLSEHCSGDVEPVRVLLASCRLCHRLLRSRIATSCPTVSTATLFPLREQPPASRHCRRIRCRCHLLQLLVGAPLQTRPRPQRRLRTRAFAQCRGAVDTHRQTISACGWLRSSWGASASFCKFAAKYSDKHIGYFDTAIEAAVARDAYVRALPSKRNTLDHHKGRKLNFPDGNPEGIPEWRVPNAFK